MANVRTFAGTRSQRKGAQPTPVRLILLNPETEFRPRDEPRAIDDERPPEPRLRNVTLILGDNGSGKSTVLRSIAAAAFGPAAKDLLTDASTVRHNERHAIIAATIRLHEQDRAARQTIRAILQLDRKGQHLKVSSGNDVANSKGLWDPVYDSRNDAFFVVGYGATRRVERFVARDAGAKSILLAKRDARVKSLFEDAFPLIPLGNWLPDLRKRNPGRYKQVVNLLDDLLKPGEYRFSGKQDARGDYLFYRGNMPVAFQSLSDGYRAYIGWVADLLHHVCYGCPSGKKLIDNRGVVVVDEIDLHLHPAWQMKVIPAIAKALPNMQFIFTSHSPLVTGSLEWMNIIKLKVISKSNRTSVDRVEKSIHGLDADQILLTDFFGLKTTRASSKRQQLTRLRQKATIGDDRAKLEYVRALSTGMEIGQDVVPPVGG